LHVSARQWAGVRRGESTEENQMPVEESGNCSADAAVAQMEGNADFPRLKQAATRALG